MESLIFILGLAGGFNLGLIVFCMIFLGKDDSDK